MALSQPVAPDGAPRGRETARHASLWALVIAVAFAGLVVCLSVDVPRMNGGIKGDEATFVSMALSVAYDSDLAYTRADLLRFWSLYDQGPEGLFLKRGRQLKVRAVPEFPFVANIGQPEVKPTRLYFGKAWVHALAAAPFVRLFGLNGLLVLNLVLLLVVVVLGYLFAAACSPEWPSLAMSSAFVGASVAPVYFVWLTPEVLNFSLVFAAFFLWFYKDAAHESSSRLDRVLTSAATDWIAAVLLGLATFSKPPNALLIGPAVLWLWWRGRYARGLAVGALFGLVLVASFAATLAVTGEANYQGGDRKTFYGGYPFDVPGQDFDTRGSSMATNEAVEDDTFAPGVFWPRLRHNVEYFFIGRHFGLLPYHFPAAFVVVLWLWWWRNWRAWQWFTLVGVAGVALALFILTPYSWSGGGGPLGNRYFLSILPALFFLVPPFRSPVLPAVAWVAGTACVLPALLNPFVVARQPWVVAEQGLPRYLPVELTMVNDLPVMLTAWRARIPYASDPDVLLYFIDGNAEPPDQAHPEIRVRGGRRADILVRSAPELKQIAVTLASLVENRVTLNAGAGHQEVAVKPGEPATVTLPVESVFARASYTFVLSVKPERGDTRENLGVNLSFR